MSKELEVSASLRFRKNDILVGTGLPKILDATGDNPLQFVQNIGTSAEAVSVGDVGSKPLVWAYNHDPTNFVTLRNGSGGADLAHLGPTSNGIPTVFQLPTGATLFAIANTAACDVEFVIAPS